ncbi:Protein priA [Psilocybe cubensis]|uniref:Protein priA n=2 Tax=Psilocybe cubensis TaxID=181762 RepID=A0ACB8GII4_PSICU|nr:Protein priA [Psilocybe cubensis]KAH9475177.1 Protein priA [Psilocybe cubensis]
MLVTQFFQLAIAVSFFVASAIAATAAYPSGYAKRAIEGYPSGYGKRSLSEASGKLLCPIGHSACQIIDRGAELWECVDTQKDLESCGGCMIQSSYLFSKKDGVDCTAIPGVSDVSCVEGKCVVRRCMAGFSINKSGDSCVEHIESSVFITQPDLTASF